MTTWQWSVIRALVRLVLEKYGRNMNIASTVDSDIIILEEALKRND